MQRRLDIYIESVTFTFNKSTVEKRRRTFCNYAWCCRPRRALGLLFLSFFSCDYSMVNTQDPAGLRWLRLYSRFLLSFFAAIFGCLKPHSSVLENHASLCPVNCIMVLGSQYHLCDPLALSLSLKQLLVENVYIFKTYSKFVTQSHCCLPVCDAGLTNLGNLCQIETSE